MTTTSYKETIIWYQTILKVSGGSPKLIVDGQYGTVTKAALKRFQKASSLTVNGKVDVITNVALNQVAMEWLNHSELNNPLGKMTAILRNSLKTFQQNNNLTPDGKVGKITRKAMVKALNKQRPIGADGGKGWKVVSVQRINI